MEIHSVKAIVKALNKSDVKYLIVGGLAVVSHGYERLTKNVDLVIGVESENILRGLRALKTLGYKMMIPVTPEEFANPGLRERWRREKNMTVLLLWSGKHRRTPVDVFVYEPFDFKKELARARCEPIFGNEIAPIVSLPTLLNLKRKAGRPQDLADIEQLRKLDALRKQL